MRPASKPDAIVHFALRGAPGVPVTAWRGVTELGFSLDAATLSTSTDPRGREP